MNTDAIINADDLAFARAKLRDDGIGKAMDTLEQTEPELFGFILTTAHCVAGRLAMFEVEQRAVRETAGDLLEAVLTCLIALRRSHARLWEEQNPPNSMDESGQPVDPEEDNNDQL